MTGVQRQACRMACYNTDRLNPNDVPVCAQSALKSAKIFFRFLQYSQLPFLSPRVLEAGRIENLLHRKIHALPDNIKSMTRLAHSPKPVIHHQCKAPPINTSSSQGIRPINGTSLVQASTSAGARMYKSQKRHHLDSGAPMPLAVQCTCAQDDCAQATVQSSG